MQKEAWHVNKFTHVLSRRDTNKRAVMADILIKKSYSQMTVIINYVSTKLKLKYLDMYVCILVWYVIF